MFSILAYNFGNAETLSRSNVSSVKYGTETITSLGAKIWKILLSVYKELTSLSTFKSKIKNWETDKCPSDYAKSISRELALFDWPLLRHRLLNIILLLYLFVCLLLLFIIVIIIYLFYYNYYF